VIGSDFSGFVHLIYNEDGQRLNPGNMQRRIPPMRNPDILRNARVLVVSVKSCRSEGFMANLDQDDIARKVVRESTFSICGQRITFRRI
jgi:hypothetical protein